MSGVRKFKVTSRDYFVSQGGPPLKTGIGRIWREGSIGRGEECSLFGLSRSESLVKGFSCLFHLTSQLQAEIYQLHMRLESPVKSTKVLSLNGVLLGQCPP